MKNFNSHYFTIYCFLKRFPVFFVGCFLLACSAPKDSKPMSPIQSQIIENPAAINLNTATAAELEKLPGIGATRAQAIIEHREKFGAFRKAEHLLLVRGIGERRLRAIRRLIKAE